MATLRAMFVAQGATGLSEDRVVNTFHFDGPQDLEAHRTSVVAALTSFYTTLQLSGASVSRYISPWIQRAAELRIYNMADAQPRQPTIHPITLEAAGDPTTHIPEECAVVLTFRASAPYTARRRGRIYIGPLNDFAVIPGSATTQTHVDGTMQQVLADAAEALAASSADWAVRSAGARVPRANAQAPLGALLAEAYYRVTNGWIDNAMDSQRRRGPDATSRLLWT